jgi:hypothetical protein
MTKLEKGKFNFQLPKRLENHLPQEIIPHILAPFKVDTSDSNSVNGWLIEHFYSENPLAKGNTILLYNRDFDSFEINIEDIDDNNLEIRRITKLTKDKLNNPQRIPMDNLTMLIDRENVSIQFSDQTPNDLQP